MNPTQPEVPVSDAPHRPVDAAAALEAEEIRLAYFRDAVAAVRMGVPR